MSLSPTATHRRPRFWGLAAAILAALIAVPLVEATALAASASYISNCGVNLRASTSTTATIVDVIASGTVVTASGSVSGGSWSAGGCGGSSATGTSWYAITAVNGTSTSTLYGTSAVYAATGLFSSYTAPSSSYLQGVDISMWQGTVNWAQVYGAGYRFAFAKATEGIGYLDPQWTTNRTGAPAAGLRLGGYHFARPDLNGGTAGATGEADWFVSQLGLTAGMVTPVLDLEVHGTLTVAALTSWVQAWLGEVYAKTGVRPIIYVSPSFWSSYMGNTQWFAQNGYAVLWIAHWTSASQPTVPAANWGGRGWTFWQWTNSGSVPGIGGRVDLDRYNGTDLTRVTYGADFKVGVTQIGNATTASTATPPTVTLKQGASVSTSVTISRTYFTLPVSLSVSGLPSSVTASLSAASTTSGTVGLTITTTHATPVGTYGFTVTGTGNGASRSFSGTVAVTDGNPPAAVGPFSRLVTGYLSSTLPVSSSWSATDPSGISAYVLDRLTYPSTWAYQGLPSALTTSVTQALKVGATYRYLIKATDGAGNTTGWTYGTPFTTSLTQQSSTAVSYGGTWRTVYATSASGGSLRYATAAGAWASYSFTGRSIAWVSYRGPGAGQAKIYLDGVYRATVNLWASAWSYRPITYVANWSASGSHTIKIVVVGTAGHPRVDLDAFVRLIPV